MRADASDGCAQADLAEHLPVGKEEDWVVMRLSGDVENMLSLESQQQQQQQAGGGAGGASPGVHCTFAHHHSAVAGRKGSVRVQERPFSRVSWVELGQNTPICERCTSTLRKHWCGQTTSLLLCQEFLAFVGRVQCRGCHEWVSGDVVQQLGDMVCGACQASGAVTIKTSSIPTPDEVKVEDHDAGGGGGGGGGPGPSASSAPAAATQEHPPAQTAPPAGSGVYAEYTPELSPMQYVFLYGDADGYRQALAQHISPGANGFPCWPACVGDCAGHMYALSRGQMVQLDRIFVGDAVRTAVTAIVYTLGGGAEQVAATTYCTAEEAAARGG